MTWGLALPADNPDATDIVAAVPFRSKRSADTFGPVPTTEPTPKSAGLGLLVLSDTMRREAMILDLSRAVKLRDMRRCHLLELQLRRLTSRMLKASCSDA